MPRSAEETNDDERSNSERETDEGAQPPAAAAAPPRRPNYVLRIEENDGKSLADVMERWWLAVEQANRKYHAKTQWWKQLQHVHVYNEPRLQISKPDTLVGLFRCPL